MQWLDRLEEEHDNLRAALRWARDETGRGEAEDANREDGSDRADGEVTASEVGLRLAGVLWRFWDVRGYLSEGREQLERVLKLEFSIQNSKLAARAKALYGAGILAWMQGDNAAARSLHEESLSIRRELGDKSSIAGSLNSLGLVAQSQGDYAAARSLFEECLAVARELGHKVGMAATLGNLGQVARSQGDYAAARSLHEESLSIRRELGDKRGIAQSLNNVGLVAYSQGDFSRAGSLYEESLAIRREVGDKGGIAVSLKNMGTVAQSQGDYAAARSLHEESLAINRELGNKWGMAVALYNLGIVAQSQGDYAAARSLHEESLAIKRDLGDKGGIAASLARLAGVVVGMGLEQGQEQQQAVKGARLLGAVEALLEATSIVLDAEDHIHYERGIASLRVQLDEEAFAAAWAEGRAMSMEQAIAYALDRAP